MRIWIVGQEIAGAKVAEMGFAVETNHVVATQGLLCPSIAGGARCGIFLEVRSGSGFFFTDFFLATGTASCKLTMPTFTANTAESKATVLADT